MRADHNLLLAATCKETYFRLC